MIQQAMASTSGGFEPSSHITGWNIGAHNAYIAEAPPPPLWQTQPSNNRSADPRVTRTTVLGESLQPFLCQEILASKAPVQGMTSAGSAV